MSPTNLAQLVQVHIHVRMTDVGPVKYLYLNISHNTDYLTPNLIPPPFVGKT